MRAQRLKDLLLEKELRNDISTAEFALRLDVPRPQVDDKSGAGGAGAGAGGAGARPADIGAPFSSKMMTSRGVIDYEKIAERLEKSLELIDRRQGRLAAFLRRGQAEREKNGMLGGGRSSTAAGTTATSIGEEATVRVTKRLADTRQELQSVLLRVRESMAGYKSNTSSSLSSSAGAGGDASSAAAAAAAATAAAGGAAGVNPFTVFVREDGTVDWDGAIQSGKDLAQRLQGKSPGEEEAPAPKPSQSLAMIDATPGMQLLQQTLQQLQAQSLSAEEEKDK